MVQLPLPKAPFSRIKNPGESITINTAGKVLVIPSGGSTLLPSFNRDTLDPNRLTIAESPFGGLKGSGSPDYAVGTVYTATDGIYITDTAGTNSTKTMTAGKLKELNLLTVNTTNKTITEEIIISNTGEGGASEVLDACTTGWFQVFSTGGSIGYNGGNGTVSLTGATSGSGYICVGKEIGAGSLTGKQFIKFSILSSVNARLVFYILNGTSNTFKVWLGTRFSITANTWTTFVLPALAPVGTAGSNPTNLAEGAGAFDIANMARMYIGIEYTGSADISIKDVYKDTGKAAYVEIQTPDNLADSSLEVQAWNSSAYASIGSYQLDSVYAAVGTPTSANWKLADGTKFYDCYNVAPYGWALFPKSYSAQTVNGSTGTLTYSANKGTKNRVGLMVTLPPYDGGRINKARLKLIFTYANSGQTSYEFADSTNASYGLQNMTRPFIALYDPTKSLIDFYLFTHKPKGLIRRRNDSGEIYELDLYPGNGAIYHGQITYGSLTADTGGTLIPDALKSTVLGSLTSFLSSYDFWVDTDYITFETTGSTFAPIISVDAGAAILWTFADGSTSTLAKPSIDYGSAATRKNTLKVTPWSALKKINIGYDGADGGATPGTGENTQEALAQQNVKAVIGLEKATNLRMWASNYNPLVSLNFDGLQYLETVECFTCTSLASVSLKNLPSLKRLNVEACYLSTIDLSEVLNLEDIRGADQAAPDPFNITFGNVGAHLWHLCIRDQRVANMPDWSKFPSLMELFIWSCHFTGTLNLYQSTIGNVKAYSNNFSNIIITDEAAYSLHILELYSGGLSQTLVDYVLEKLDLHGRAVGSLKIQSNAAPSETGLTHKNNLIARGWTVTTA